MRLLLNLLIVASIMVSCGTGFAANIKQLLDNLTPELKYQPKISYKFKLMDKGDGWEKWSFILDITNNTNEVKLFDAEFHSFDKDGFKIERIKTVYQKDIQPGTIRTVKDLLYIEKVDEVRSIKLIGDGLYN